MNERKKEIGIKEMSRREEECVRFHLAIFLVPGKRWTPFFFLSFSFLFFSTETVSTLIFSSLVCSVSVVLVVVCRWGKAGNFVKPPKISLLRESSRAWV